MDNDRKCRIVSFDSTVFRAVHISAAPPGRATTSAWECSYCGRIFIGSPSQNSAGFAHDCEIPRQLMIETPNPPARGNEPARAIQDYDPHIG
jgi:hypothetical protein